MSTGKRDKYKPVTLLSSPERPVDPGHPISPSSRPTLDYTHSLSLSECSSSSSFLSQHQEDSEEPRVAVTLADKSSPVKVVRHDVSSSSQTKTSSGVLKVVQYGNNTSLDDKNEGVNFEDENFHVHSPPAFLQNQPAFIDDDNYYRFSTNFVSPPLRKTSANPHSRGAVVQVRSSSDDVTSTTTMETAGDLTELTALMESVNAELGSKKTRIDATKQEERKATKKELFADSGTVDQSMSLAASKQQPYHSESATVKKKTTHKKGRGVVASRYMDPVKTTKPVTGVKATRPAESKTRKSTVAGKDQRRSLREHSPNVRQQLVLDHTLPTPGTFYSSAMVSSTPANEELQGMPSDIRAAADDGSFIASYNAPTTSTSTHGKYRKVPHHHHGSMAAAAATTDKQKRQEYEALRCRALQWAYLDVMTQKLFKQQEEQAKAELHEMYSGLVKKMEENAELQRSIDRIEHQMTVDSALHAQQQGLGAVVAHLPEFEPQYRMMVQSLDNTRHHMKTNEVVVPPEDELLAKLARSQELMEKINAVIAPKMPEVATMAETVKELEHVAAETEKENLNLQNMTKELEDLQLQEISLRYHIEQLKQSYNITV
ncbi:uncharacterized protein [Dysidea avara]|uniref:uncharacterized protein n=1 Tax=Dysidea avara TaxID=196820 RepID=UPI003332E23C